ncbi:MAG: L-aspartate oxidase [Leptospirillia bacterium]
MTMHSIETDFLIIGAGIAGLRAAIELSEAGRVTVVSKGDSCSVLAQGGVAVAQHEGSEDSLHLEDTLRAGKGQCDPEAARVMVSEGPERIAELVRWGACFDRDEAGGFALAQEGAHSRRRILRAGGDATGKEIVRVLRGEAERKENIRWLDGRVATELLVDQGRCVGVLLAAPKGGEADALAVSARAVLLASGGAGQVYRRTSNPPTATGDGIAMAMRAGARLRDMEFVQFHPTVLAEPYPPFLLSEAMRGEGGVLRNRDGEAFMRRYHPMAELASRDEVSRAIWHEMQRDDAGVVFLDMTAISAEVLEKRFPTIFRTCRDLGLDISTTLIPVVPSAHFLMGGVRVDDWGQSTLPGLFAVGEAACSGVHGANRLASNSLLEALVFGARAARAAVRAGAGGRVGAKRVEAIASELAAHREPGAAERARSVRPALQEIMWKHVGVVRNAQGLHHALSWIDREIAKFPYDPFDCEGIECLNLLGVARAIADSALCRTEALGAHFRSDGIHVEETVAYAG